MTLMIPARRSEHSSAARLACISIAALGLLAALPARLEAQVCTPSGSPVAFEPNPPAVPGVSRPITLSSGFNNSLALYRPGGSGQPRLLMQESFGYSVLDLSTPTNPTALYYRDNRLPVGGPDSVTTGGDGQSDVYSSGVSDDGQRAVFSLGGPADAWYTIVGGPSGDGFSQRGSFPRDERVVRSFSISGVGTSRTRLPRRSSPWPTLRPFPRRSRRRT